MIGKVANILAWISVTVATLFLMLTLLTTYVFLKGNLLAELFNGYFTFQCSMVATMFIWALNFSFLKDNPRNRAYSIGCLLIGFLTIFFMFMKVN